MTVNYVGQLAFAAGADRATGNIVPPLCPILVNSEGVAAVSIAAAIDGLLALQAQITITPPNLTAILAALVEFQAQCTAALSAGLPSVSFDISAAATLVANLTAALTLVVTLEALLALPVEVSFVGSPYPTIGTTPSLGVAAGLLPPLPGGSPSKALVLVAPDLPPPMPASPARAALSDLLGGITYPSVGIFTNLGQMSPVSLNAIPEALAGIEYQLGLATQLHAFVKVNPPTFTASIKATVAFAAHLKAAAALALPKVDFQLKAIARIVADLQARFSLLYTLGLALNRPDATLCVYTWDDTGPPGFAIELVAKVTPNWDGPTGFMDSSILPAQVAIMGTADSVSWTALVDSAAGAFFGGAA
jgi:hypothetical protein